MDKLEFRDWYIQPISYSTPSITGVTLHFIVGSTDKFTEVFVPFDLTPRTIDLIDTDTMSRLVLEKGSRFGWRGELTGPVNSSANFFISAWATWQRSS